MQCEFNVMDQLDMFELWHAWAQFLMIQVVN